MGQKFSFNLKAYMSQKVQIRSSNTIFTTSKSKSPNPKSPNPKSPRITYSHTMIHSVRHVAPHPIPRPIISIV